MVGESVALTVVENVTVAHDDDDELILPDCDVVKVGETELDTELLYDNKAEIEDEPDVDSVREGIFIVTELVRETEIVNVTDGEGEILTDVEPVCDVDPVNEGVPDVESEVVAVVDIE